MDNLLDEVAKGFLRGVGYLLAEVFFGTVCYWLGWPICKVMTLGKYPSSNDVVYLDNHRGRQKSFWCAAVGLLALVIIGLYLAGQFS